MLSKVLVGIAGTALLAGAATFHQGMIHVNVREKQPGGEHVRVVVPAAMVPWAMKLAPEEKLRRASEQARNLLPAVRVAATELGKCPDGVLVEVRDGNDHVRIEKRGGSLVIDVDTPRETVHVAVPLRTIRAVVSEIEERSPAL